MLLPQMLFATTNMLFHAIAINYDAKNYATKNKVVAKS